VTEPGDSQSNLTLPSAQASDEGAEKLAHFTILGPLGEGGMGIVYRARDEKLGRVVALKVLPTEFEADEKSRNRFIREARSAAAVTHPNIVTVFEIGEAQGRVFIAMELVQGRSLRALMEEGPVPVPTALRLAIQLVAGVAKAHEAGVVHRDLKPENALVTAEQHVKVLDFGLAKQSEVEGTLVTVTVTGTGELVLGTPAYMSPEQMRAQTVTPATDVFALGVILYELLTGHRPFTGNNLPQLVRSIERDAPKPPSSVDARIPAAFDAVVAKCLAKEPAQRYANAGALLAELHKLEAAPSRGQDATVAEKPPADSPRERARVPARAARPSWVMQVVPAAIVLAVAIAAAVALGRCM
jgi:eukaryotic-like serine/threonine-protein kinase